jgi:uncharacterized repeat protein (TIGR04076 family)
MKKFRENPRNEAVLSKASELVKKTIIAEVIDSHGCNSQHSVGDKFYFDAAGNLLGTLCTLAIHFVRCSNTQEVSYGNQTCMAWMDQS